MRTRIQKLQWLRRSVQLGFLAVALMAPAMARYTNYLMARELDKNLEKWDGSVQGEVLELIDDGLRSLPDHEKFRVNRMVRNRKVVLETSGSVRGGPWSLELAGVSFTDPLAASESALASARLPWVLLVGVCIPVLLTLVLGRVFCSWLCPVGFLLELNDKLRNFLRWLELKPRNLRPPRQSKYWLLGLGLAGSALLGLPMLGMVYPPAVLGRELHELVFAFFDSAELGEFGPRFWLSGLGWGSALLGGIALFELLLAPRWWCRVMCPGGALYSLLGAARLIRVKRDAEACTGCGNCNRVCPMALRPMQDVMGMDCDSCGLCISSCGDKALDYKLWDRLRPSKEPVALAEKRGVRPEEQEVAA